MVATPTPRPKPVNRERVNPALAPLQGLVLSFPVAVAYSGGADSTALLHAAAATWPGRLHAIHVHHGLQAAADGFASHCEQVCAALAVPLRTFLADARHQSGESPEDAARRARYLALANAAQALGVRTVLLAQHADDQVETLLLALSRGAGLPGLAAMPVRLERHGVQFVRPLLAVSGPAIRAWLKQARVPFVEDPSNADKAFTRNRIRHDLLPALEKTFPQFRETFSRSARHAAQGQELLALLAQQDMAAAGDPPAIGELQKLSPARQANLLRYWLRSVHGAAASAAQMAELLDQVAACTTRGHAIRIKVGNGLVERSATRLVFTA